MAPARLVFGEILFLDYRRLPYYVLTCPFLCVFTGRDKESLGVSSFSYEDQSKLMTSFNLNYLSKGLIYRYSHIGIRDKILEGYNLVLLVTVLVIKYMMFQGPNPTFADKFSLAGTVYLILLWFLFKCLLDHKLSSLQ